MSNNEEDLTHHRLLLRVSICILVLAGFLALYCALSGESHGLKAWLLAFGPWSVALVAFSRLKLLRGKNPTIH